MAFLKNTEQHEQSDLELVALFRQSGDLELLAILFQRYMELLYGLCLKYLKDPETARDAVMQLFEELARKLPQHEVEHFRGWLYTLARNYCLMQLRTPRNLKTTEFNPDYMQSADEAHLNGVWQKEAHLQQLENCLKTLSGDQRTTVELFYLQNKCYKEIAETTGIEWNKVRSHIQNGRRNLRLCMEKQETIKIES